MKCCHDVEYPSEGGEHGPWTCNPDGSNPNCPNCSPDAWVGDFAIEVLKEAAIGRDTVP